MNFKISLVVALFVLVPAVTFAEDPAREDWQADVAAAKARAETFRNALRKDLERRRIEHLLEPLVSADVDRARNASEQVRNDFSLQRGDIVSTVDGLFVFVGDADREHSPSDFVPLSPSNTRGTGDVK